MSAEHECPAMVFALSGNGVDDFYGEAVDRIVHHKGNWLACHQAEYATVIAFCPFCGVRLLNTAVLNLKESS